MNTGIDLGKTCCLVLLVYPDGGEAVVFTLNISRLTANFTTALRTVCRYILSGPGGPEVEVGARLCCIRFCLSR